MKAHNKRQQGSFHQIVSARARVNIERPMISVLILTYNEEVNIRECIESIPPSWRSDVIVLDSHSEDSTGEIADQMGARVITNVFQDYATQRNFGLNQNFENDWILMLDADERMTHELALEVSRTLRNSDPRIGMYRIRRKDYFLGRWLKRSSGYPTYFPRLFRKGTVQVTRSINEEYHCKLDVTQLAGHLIHYPFNKGLTWWYSRHAKYAALEAQVLREERERGSISLGMLFSADPAFRRLALKQIAYRLPGRPILVFWYLYLIRGGFLDGVAGFQYARMRAAYENMIDTIALAIKLGERP